ncbi:MAG TPA: multicopper oxidase domain-containing protein [Nitrososphaeraceae archaeon]|nr:multicopper oxidase domain-containing protein [Nitrososphaeraceae archaeon]
MRISPILIGVVIISTAVAVIFTISSGAYKGLNSIMSAAQTSDSDIKSGPKVVGSHTPGYPITTTAGIILDPLQTAVDMNPANAVVDPMKYLREFNYGKVSKLSDGKTLREFTLVASDNLVKEISPGVFYNVWTFNGTVPGPTIRATEGDIVRINFINNGSMPHSLHLHGVHPANMDGVFEMISPGGEFTYEFTAEPFGVFPYHCHMTPLEEHIAHGLYGVFIVDPKTTRPPADEMVMVMNGYDTDFDTENNFYTVNGVPYYYMHHPVQIQKDKLVRIYLVNMLEFDPVNNFHLHANMFNYYPSGTRLQPDELTDIVTTNQGERGILEFTYKYPGKYMFHAHKTEFAEKGWMGTFLVTEGNESNISNQTNGNSFYDSLNNSFVGKSPKTNGGQL